MLFDNWNMFVKETLDNPKQEKEKSDLHSKEKHKESKTRLKNEHECSIDDGCNISPGTP